MCKQVAPVIVSRRHLFGVGSGVRSKWPFTEFAVGDELVVPCIQSDLARRAVYRVSRAVGYRFKSKLLSDGSGVRIWRVE